MGRDSGTAARASCAAGRTGAAGDGRDFARGATPAPSDVEGLGATGAACTGAVSTAGATGASETTASDCSTPPVATSDAGAAAGSDTRAGRLARKAPAAPMVMHEAATTATVEVLISMDDL